MFEWKLRKTLKHTQMKVHCDYWKGPFWDFQFRIKQYDRIWLIESCWCWWFWKCRWCWKAIVTVMVATQYGLIRLCLLMHHWHSDVQWHWSGQRFEEDEDEDKGTLCLIKNKIIEDGGITGDHWIPLDHLGCPNLQLMQFFLVDLVDFFWRNKWEALP